MGFLKALVRHKEMSIKNTFDSFQILSEFIFFNKSEGVHLG